MSLEINYIDAPEGAQEKMTVTGENGNDISIDTQVATGARDIPWATLEPGTWKLDGTMKIMPDNPQAGWWSRERSRDVGNGENGFEKPPKITLTFPTPFDAAGVTFTFSPATNQWCNKINVKWYSNVSMILDKDYYPTSPKWTLEELVDGFDAIEVTLLSTNKPGQFAKVQRIEIGRNVLISAEDLVKTTLVNEVDPTLCTLPVDTMSFDMRDSKQRGFMPQENQRVELIQDGKLRAVQYIRASTRKSKTDYTVNCQSCIGLLNDEFLGGLYAEKPVSELLTEILGLWEYDLADVFKGKTVSGYIPVSTQREALQLVCFAIGAMPTTQGSGRISLEPVPKAVTSKFTADDIIIGGNARTESRYARVEIYSHAYIKSQDVETLMDAEGIVGENVLVTFRYPHYDYEITGGEITSFGDNWVKITASGLVTLTAKTYTHNTRVHTRNNPAATAKERGNYIAVKEATLIHDGNVQEAVDRLYSVVQSRQTANQQVIVSDQKAGQMTTSLMPWGDMVQGIIYSMDSTMTQTGHIANIQIHGVEIKLDSVWLYSGEIYSGGQEVIY